jgi:hypothetical protein
VATDNIKVNLQGDKTVNLSSFLSSGLIEINNRSPLGNNQYIQACNYSYSPNQNTTDISLTWVFNTPAVKTYSL